MVPSTGTSGVCTDLQEQTKLATYLFTAASPVHDVGARTIPGTNQMLCSMCSSNRVVLIKVKPSKCSVVLYCGQAKQQSVLNVHGGVAFFFD